MSALTKWTDPMWGNGSSWMPSVVEDFFGKDIDNYFTGMMKRANIPSINISQTDKRYQIDVAAPGLKKEDFKLEVDDETLTISAERKEEKEEKDKKYTRREYSYSSFSRSFVMPKGIDANAVKAEYADGVLRINLPKEEKAAKKKKKEISVS